MRSVNLALAAGLTILAASLGLVLSRAPASVAGSNGVPTDSSITFTPHNTVNCTAGGTLPEGTQAIRVSLSANNGPRVRIKALADGAVVTEGVRGAGWGIDETVTVPVKRVSRSVHHVVICTTVGPAVEAVQANGARIRSKAGGRVVTLRMEYLRPGPRSWLSLASSIARHMGVAHAPSGTWVAYLLIAVMLAVLALASRLALRELR